MLLHASLQSTGRWAGREVAIKCIEHDSETREAVENEVQLMLAMDHDNVVKAFHYITYRHTMNIASSSADIGPYEGRNGSQTSAVSDNGTPPNKNQRQQQKQLQQLQRQLQKELGPKNQWLLDAHLGFSGKQQQGNGAAARDSAQSLASGGDVAAGAAAAGATASSSSASVGCSSGSGTLVIDATHSGSSAALNSSPAVQHTEGSSSSAASRSAQLVSPSPQQQQQQHQQPAHAGSPAADAAAAAGSGHANGVLEEGPSNSGSSSNGVQEHPPASAIGGADGSRTSTGQPLTPNQKAQLQQYLQRQQHLLSTSGMRMRSTMMLPLPTASAAGTGSSANSSENSSANESAGIVRPAREPHDVQRARTYIVQGVFLVADAVLC